MNAVRPIKAADLAVVTTSKGKFLWLSDNARRALKGAR